MTLRFYDDPETGVPHIWEHGVNEREVYEVMRNPDEDFQGTDNSRQALGRTNGGRYLRVIYVPDDEVDSYFIVTAYPITGKPLQAFRKRLRRRKR